MSLTRTLTAYKIHGLEVNMYHKAINVEIHFDTSFAYILVPYHCEYNSDYIMNRLLNTEYEPTEMFVEDETFLAVFMFAYDKHESYNLFKKRMIMKANMISKWGYVKHKYIHVDCLACF